jgi:outer membrane protein OmpA-like peptidoglycan-associated protein
MSRRKWVSAAIVSATLLGATAAVGQPAVDPDGDGIYGSVDLCADLPEDFDGWKDDDGCPDNDNDTDGLSDIRDMCPMDAEDVDGFEDLDGCPDVDNDWDSIPDELDDCPDEPEIFDGRLDEDGCPDDSAAPEPSPSPRAAVDGGLEIVGERVTADAIGFETGGAVLLPESHPFLRQLADYLAAHPEFGLRIEVHTDSRGSGPYNLRMSQERAEAIAAALGALGVDPGRLTASGFGETRPIAPNTTEEGRAQNRRVEIYLEAR